jgi:hypothetical protein
MSTWEAGEIVAFVKARLDEEEKLARRLSKGGNPNVGTAGQWNAYVEGGGDGWAFEDDSAAPVGAIVKRRSVAVHVTRYDPARALREVEAKRKRVALMTEAQAEMDRLIADPGADRAGQAMAVGRARAATVAVKYDAAVWSDHADYKGEA